MNRTQRRAQGHYGTQKMTRIPDHFGIRCSGVASEEDPDFKCENGVSIPFSKLGSQVHAEQILGEAGWTLQVVEESPESRLHIPLCEECTAKLFMPFEEDGEDVTVEQEKSDEPKDVDGPSLP